MMRGWVKYLACLGVALFALLPASAQAQEARLIAALPFHNSEPRFGGFSALSLSNQGRDMLALSDKGNLMRARIVRDDAQTPMGLEVVDFLPVRQIDGENTAGRNADSEGLAVVKNGARAGGLYISFEGFHRVRFYDSITSAAQDIPRHPDFRGLSHNTALEALAVDVAGALYTLPESSSAADAPFPLYRFWQGQWDIVAQIPRRDEFLIVGADFAPDGRLFILERAFSWVSGFVNRVRSFRLDDSNGENGVHDERMHLTTDWGQFDNLEGISLWRDKNGRTRITMISDDNFRIYQRTEVVEYILGE